MCIKYGDDSMVSEAKEGFQQRPLRHASTKKVKRLYDWSTGELGDIIASKAGVVDELEDLTLQFAEKFNCLKPLVLKLRDLLFFPIAGASKDYGTPQDNLLYEQILNAFDNTITYLSPKVKTDLDPQLQYRW